jgi:hypothetical protein
MSGDSNFLDGPDLFDGPGLFDGPKTLIAKAYTVVRLSPGRHELVLTCEKPFMIAIIPTQEAN